MSPTIKGSITINHDQSIIPVNLNITNRIVSITISSMVHPNSYCTSQVYTTWFELILSLVHLDSSISGLAIQLGVGERIEGI